MNKDKMGTAALLWRDAPLLNCVLYSFGIAHAEISNLPVQRLDLVPTAIFPLLIPIAVYGLRWRESTQLEKRLAITICAGVVLGIGGNLLLGMRTVLSHHQLRNIYELVALLNTLVLMIHAWNESPRRVGFFLGPCLAYGMLLENGGILLGYFSEMNYRWYLGPLPAPLATVSGWVTVFYITTWTVWEVKKCSPRTRRMPVFAALVAVFVALCLDLQIDPLASAVGFWTWHSSLAQGWLGVPFLNYVAWMSAVFPFALLVFWREAQWDLAVGGITEPKHRNWVLVRVPLALGVAALAFLVLMTLVEGGIEGPTFTILREALGKYL